MAFCKLLGVPLLPVSHERELPIIKRPGIQVVKSIDRKVPAPKSINLSRRDSLLYLTAETLGAFTIFSTQPAEARVGRLEGKRKVMEKLEKIREQAGKRAQEKEKKTPLSQTLPQGKGLPSLATVVPFPNPQEGSIGPFVEARQDPIAVQ